jgi:hypothetical protein
MQKITTLMLMIALLGCFTTSAFGGEETQKSDWDFNLAPFYLWAVSMDGDMTVMGNTAPLKADFKDITNSLEGILTVHFEGMNKGRLGFLTDISYLKIGGQQTTPGPTLDVDFTSVMVELAGVYRINLDKNALDLIGGFRYYDLNAEIDVVGVPPRIDKSQDWVDAMLGARYIWTIADRWSFVARGDLGIGGSDPAWNLAGLFDYQPWKHASLLFGYRYMSIDYETGSGPTLFRYNVKMHGPLLGVNFVW